MSSVLSKRLQFFVYLVSVILLVAILIQVYRIYFKKDNPSEALFYIDETVLINDYDIVFGNDTCNKTIYMYSSYNCMYCTKFFNEVFPAIRKEYIDNGKLKFVLKLLDNGTSAPSLQAVQLAMCTNAYGNYSMLHDLLIFNSKVIFTKDFNELVDDLINQNEFIAKCMVEKETLVTLENNNNDYKVFELKGTPSFIYNGIVYSGFYDLSTFKSLIIK